MGVESTGKETESDLHGYGCNDSCGEDVGFDERLHLVGDADAEEGQIEPAFSPATR